MCLEAPSRHSVHWGNMKAKAKIYTKDPAYTATHQAHTYGKMVCLGRRVESGP